MPRVGGLVAFDWGFSFCTLGAVVREAGIDRYAFERRFSVQSQSYAAFAQSTIRMLSLAARLGANGTDEIPRVSPSSGALPSGDSRPEAAHAVLAQLWWVAWLLAGIVLLVGICTFIAMRRRRRRLKREAREAGPDDIAGPGGVPLAWLAGSAAPAPAQARAIIPFGVGGEEASMQGLLALAEGDLVEVQAAGGGWLFGHLVHATDCAGFFPESCVAWIGRPLPQREREAASQPEPEPGAEADDVFHGRLDWSPPSSPTHVDVRIGIDEEGQELRVRDDLAARLPGIGGPMVRATVAFSSSEVTEDPGGLRERCLELQGGEAVEVLAAGAGWLYGRLCEAPHAEGFFPEDRAEWLARGANCEGPDGGSASVPALPETPPPLPVSGRGPGTGPRLGAVAGSPRVGAAEDLGSGGPGAGHLPR